MTGMFRIILFKLTELHKFRQLLRIFPAACGNRHALKPKESTPRQVYLLKIVN